MDAGVTVLPVAQLADVQVLAKSTSMPRDPEAGLGSSGASGSGSGGGSGGGGGGGAPFRAQAGALLRKNAVYQRRNWCSNLCLLSAPVFFCLLLFGIQLAVNRLLLTGEDYECGCKCTRCCYQGDPSNCTATSFGACRYTCLERDKRACGIQYSSPRQSFFCAIPRPSSWPAVMQVPRAEWRAEPWRPDAALLVTGADRSAAEALSGALLPRPAATAANLLAVRRYLEDWNATGGGAGGGSLPGEVLSKMGLTLGSSGRVVAGMYIEPALTGDQLYALWPTGTCEALGLAGQVNISLGTMVSAMVNASNSPAAARVLNGQLAGLLGGGGGSGGAAGGEDASGVFGRITQLALNCTEMPPVFVATAAEVSRKLYCGYYQARCGGGGRGPQQLAGAYDWKATGAGRFEPDIYFNDTYGLPRGGSPTVYQRVPAAISAAVGAWMRTYLGANSAVQLVGVQETPKAASELRLDFSSLLGPLFFTWVAQMLLPIFLMQLVYEKEKRLRMMMKMHGLGDGAYWLVTYWWFWALYVAYIAIFLVFGSAIRLNMFTRNNYGVQIITYGIFGHNMIAFAFLLSCFFTSSKTATVFAYLVVFGTGLIGSLLLARLIPSNLWYMTLIELVPAFALFRALYEFGEYSFIAVYRGAYGMTWHSLSDRGNGVTTAWVILAAQWPLFMGLAWYLEQVFAGGTGNRRHPLFFLDRFRKGSKAGRAAKLAAAARDAAAEEAMAEDVAAEHERVSVLEEPADYPIVVQGIRKIYPGQDGQPPKVAVRQLDLVIESGECFGLLGPNGAGKSTSINMMIGLLEPSHGTCLIGGRDIRSDMDAIYTRMGVCPQHDLLWDTLTGREHLLFYGRLKGLIGAELAHSVECGLRAVNLWNGGVADKQARAYSGGMKRRLSVAISFMGDPTVVYLDEPSTGLDPASRRNLWDVVKSNKAGRGIVLTTHSMEEAETLCDRLGIFVDGRLVCIGNPKEITSRYGGYLVMTLTVAAGQEAAARAFVERLSPSARLTYSVGGTLKFELPSDEAPLSAVFAAVAEAKGSEGAPGALTVLDWGVANATLEEVFIKFARQMQIKAGE